MSAPASVASDRTVTLPDYNVNFNVVPVNIADPGTATAISVVSSANISFTIGSAGLETNTLAAPTYAGQEMHFYAGSVGTGTREITVSAAINQAGNTKITLNTVDDSILLKAIDKGAAKAWRVVYNDGCTLS